MTNEGVLGMTLDGGEQGDRKGLPYNTMMV
jgi:hypothetical protein